MTPAERMTAERKHIEQSGACYVTPYRMAKLMDAAGIACVTEEEDEFE